jgi:predicted small metal-binding protein
MEMRIFSAGKEISMTKVLKCGDVVPGCNTTIRGDSDHDVLRKAAEHAKTDHQMDTIPPDVLSKVKSAIHDEGESRSQKAGSAN